MIQLIMSDQTLYQSRSNYWIKLNWFAPSQHTSPDPRWSIKMVTQPEDFENNLVCDELKTSGKQPFFLTSNKNVSK